MEQSNALKQQSHWLLPWQWVVPLFCLCFAAIITEYQARQLVEQRQNQALQQLVGLSGQLRSFVESELNTSLYMSLGLASHIRASDGKLAEKEMLFLLQSLLEQGKHIRNIGLAPGNVLTLIYPVQGNERALGLNYQNLPQQWPDIKQLIDAKEPRLVGPVALVQGGDGYVYRLPLFLNDGSYWGIISTVLDLSAFNQMLLQQANSYQVQVGIREKNAGSGQALFGYSDLFSEEALILDLNIKGAQWQIAVRFMDEATGWGLWQWRLTGASLSIVFCLMLAWLLHSYRRSALFADALQDNEMYSRRIMNSVLDVIVTTDLDGTIDRVNSAVSTVFGYLPLQLTGQPFSMLLAPGQAGVLATLSPGEGAAVELQGLRYSGEVFAMDLSRNSTEHHGKPRYVWLIRDISERKKVEQLKNDFVSTVSHELRTPLTAISGALGLAVGGALGELNDKQLHMLTLAQQNSQRLGKLINDLLDIEKLAVNKMQFKLRLWPLAALLRQAIDLNQPVAFQRQVELELLSAEQDDLWVEVDEVRVQQVMANLLANAIRHSPAGASVQVTMELSAKTVRVSVIDQGPGVSESFEPRLFEKFSQADSSDRRQVAGTGLGLAICKDLIKAMRGDIGYQRANSGGACFYFTLPLATELSLE
ncbi:ATP-binding protein [Rheinheimera sp. 1928-s]|uniref:sensor histidine kinase n=1 Tax=Rheinheimera sp. 1928-s TaxID=3033803 RepID=UPI0026377B04|nr:ATP-binding protein [Rheinheimera sp. 1928-s]MDF3124861.1 ATP-binding protein [Rheinheimera sp. 1928-s]